jgi:uncharacterized protein YndB with AHSA1/START domain
VTDARSREPTWSLDREIVLCRVVDAPRELVWRAWTDPEHLPRWFGPKGFTCTTHAIDLCVGGSWRFDMIAPDGTVFPNRMTFLQLRAPELIVFDHGGDSDDDPNRFRVTVTFDAQSNGKTVVTLRQLHPSKARRDAVIAFGAVEFGMTTMDKLAAHVAAMAG